MGRYRRQPPPGFLTPASGNPFYPGKLTRRSPRLAPASPLPIPLPLAVTRLTQNALLVEVQPCSDPLVGHSEKGFGLAFRKVCQGPEGQRHYDVISASISLRDGATPCAPVRYGQAGDLGNAAKPPTTGLSGSLDAYFHRAGRGAKSRRNCETNCARRPRILQRIDHLYSSAVVATRR